MNAEANALAGETLEQRMNYYATNADKFAREIGSTTIYRQYADDLRAAAVLLSAPAKGEVEALVEKLENRKVEWTDNYGTHYAPDAVSRDAAALLRRLASRQHQFWISQT